MYLQNFIVVCKIQHSSDILKMFILLRRREYQEFWGFLARFLCCYNYGCQVCLKFLVLPCNGAGNESICRGGSTWRCQWSKIHRTFSVFDCWDRRWGLFIIIFVKLSLSSLSCYLALTADCLTAVSIPITEVWSDVKGNANLTTGLRAFQLQPILLWEKFSDISPYWSTGVGLRYSTLTVTVASQDTCNHDNICSDQHLRLVPVKHKPWLQY